jgi:hypothetical protein
MKDILYTFPKEKDATLVLVAHSVILLKQSYCYGFFNPDHLFMGTGLEAMQSRRRMLQDLTTDTMGMSVLSDGVTLESLGTLFCFLANGYITSFCLISLTTKRNM